MIIKGDSHIFILGDVGGERLGHRRVVHRGHLDGDLFLGGLEQIVGTGFLGQEQEGGVAIFVVDQVDIDLTIAHLHRSTGQLDGDATRGFQHAQVRIGQRIQVIGVCCTRVGIGDVSSQIDYHIGVDLGVVHILFQIDGDERFLDHGCLVDVSDSDVLTEFASVVFKGIGQGMVLAIIGFVVYRSGRVQNLIGVTAVELDLPEPVRAGGSVGIRFRTRFELRRAYRVVDEADKSIVGCIFLRLRQCNRSHGQGISHTGKTKYEQSK